MKPIKPAKKKTATKTTAKKTPAPAPARKRRPMETKELELENEALRERMAELEAANQQQAERLSDQAGQGDRIYDLEQRINAQAEENRRLTEENERLKAGLEASGIAYQEAPRWIRGKLPGDKFIKVNEATGEFEEIDQEEWLTLVR